MSELKLLRSVYSHFHNVYHGFVPNDGLLLPRNKHKLLITINIIIHAIKKMPLFNSALYGDN